MHIRSLLLGSFALSAMCLAMPMFAIADEGGSGGGEAEPGTKIDNVEGDVNVGGADKGREDVTKPATDTPADDVVGGDEDAGEDEDKDDESEEEADNLD